MVSGAGGRYPKALWGRLVLLFPPVFDDDLSLPQRVEEISVQQFVPEPGIKAFDVSILPWISWFDEGCFRTNRLNPSHDVLGNEL